MSDQYCPKCNTLNSPDYRFCKRCGAELSSAEPTVPSAFPDPSANPNGPKKDTGSLPVITQMGEEGRATLGLWQPFAGYGQRGRHVSWLLSGLGARAEDLLSEVSLRFGERQIPGAKIIMRYLSGRGLLAERRRYHFAQRGAVTVGLYIARFGQDLYISQVSYAKGPISPLRLLALLTMIAFQLGSMVALVAMSGSLGLGSLLNFQDPVTTDVIGGIATLICCFGPLWSLNGLALTVACYYMIYRFVADRDPFALLRSHPNEFQQDDIIALEKAVEETVRQSLDAIGIDRSLMPEASEYGVRRRLI